MDQHSDVTRVLQFFTSAVALVGAFEVAELRPNLRMWSVVNGHALDIAITEWCKLFGSERQEKVVHWRRVASDRDAFLAGLLAAVGKTGAEFEAYQDAVLTYRDKALAHLDADWRQRIPNYPRLDIARVAAYYYWDHVNPQHAGGMKAHLELLQDQWAKTLTVSIGATKHMFDW